MRFIKVSMLVLFLCFGAATMAWSITIQGGVFGDTDVGSLDLLLGEQAFAGGPGGNREDAQQAWVNSILNPSGESANWYLRNTNVPYFNTDTPNVFAFQMVSPPPEYFVVFNAAYMVLYENNENLNWGVFQGSDGLNIPSDNMFISNVTQYNPVPEPGTILLLSAGLFGLVAVSRRKFRK